jgi:hypothetical protein
VTTRSGPFERAQRWLTEKPQRADAAALIGLTLLWALFFWRALTPNPPDQVSYPEGDFSGQFVAFGAYQARRLLAGEIPLWNPYNYGGHSFIGDTQSAVFYPPRLLTILISRFTGGWGYAALQAEALAHYWMGAVFMYLFVRTATRSRIAGMVSGLTLAFGGYLTGYPPLQTAVLEAGIWLPLGLLAVFRASTPGPERRIGGWHVGWLALGALSVGLSLLAGHPQTTLFLLYVMLAYVIHRAAINQIGWTSTLPIAGALFALGFGVAAVQVLPGLEYTRLTVRADLGYDALARGFPMRDLVVLVLPNVVTVWSPLYSGIAGLALAVIAVWRKEPGARFWGIVVLVALIFSFGGATLLYQIAYLLAPGVSWFRGQERAAYVVAQGIAVLSGLGVAALRGDALPAARLSRGLGIAAAVAWALAVETFIIHQFVDAEHTQLASGVMFLALLVTLAWLLLGRLSGQARQAWWAAGLIALIVFDLFSTSMGTNWQSIPAAARQLYNRNLVASVTEMDDGLYRVDGRLGLGDNYGTLAGVQDIRGISPLRLNALENYLTRLPEYRLYELLNVKYVFTDWEQLERPTTIVAQDDTTEPPVRVHRWETALPRAWMVYQVMNTPDEAQALGWLADASFDPRMTVILDHAPDLTLPAEPPEAAVEITAYEPERIGIRIDTPADGVLVVSEWAYPGWRATIDGAPSPILQANAGLRALPLRAGQHEVVLTYRPISVTAGAAISLISLIIVLGGLIVGFRTRRNEA